MFAPHSNHWEIIFGDELQSQLNSIKALNKISNLAAGASSRRFHEKPGYNNKNGKPFLGHRERNPITARKTVGEKEAVTANCSLNDLLDQVDINNFVSLIHALTNYFTSREDCFKAGYWLIMSTIIGNCLLLTKRHCLWFSVYIIIEF